MINKVDIWWSSLRISEKERIATKAAQKTGNKKDMQYPECSRWWISLRDQMKRTIYEHCVTNQGLILNKWYEGHPLSY
ncbi:MAG: hypothetical protein MJZ15_10940 [Bacteroidales bacterium]|nr:hypothetical protein [Bacteroidales bacterium]